MNNRVNLIKKISSKDEKQALTIIKEMIENSDIELFKELVEQSDFLFPFIRENIAKRLEMCICKANYNSLFAFLEIYSPDYDRVFASAFNVFGDDEIKNKMLSLLKTGSISQKTYAAKYFEIKKDFFAVKDLIENAFSEEEYLAYACASALGELNEQKSYQIALEKLNSDDDFESLKGLNFFVSYMKNPPMEEIFNAFKKSGMPENFAGKIAYLKPLPSFLKENIEITLSIIDSIISGFGEILPLSEVFNFELYNTIGMLTEIQEPEFLSQIAVVLLKAKSKFNIISDNEEYLFNEDKNTKNEIFEINNMINSFGEAFWNNLKKLSYKELSQNKKRVLSALEVIKEYKIQEAVEQILNMIYETTDETLICEGLSTLKILDKISYISKEESLNLLKNETLRAIVESFYK